MRLALLIRRRHSRMWQKIRPVSIQEGVTLLIMRQVVGKPQFVRYRKHAHLIPKLFHFDTGRNFCQILPTGRSIAVDATLLEASHGRMSILAYREMCQEAASSASHREMRGGIAPFGIGAPAQRRPGSIGAPAQCWAGGIGLAARKRLVLGHDVRGCGFWAGVA